MISVVVPTILYEIYCQDWVSWGCLKIGPKILLVYRHFANYTIHMFGSPPS